MKSVMGQWQLVTAVDHEGDGVLLCESRNVCEGQQAPLHHQ